MEKMKILISIFLFFIFAAGNAYSQDMKNNDAKKLFNEGNEKIRAGNYDGSVKDYTDALKIEESYMIYQNRCVAYQRLSKFDLAKEDALKVISLQQNSYEGYDLLGLTYYLMGNYDESVKNLERALDLAQTDKEKNKVKTKLARAYTKLGSKEETNANSSKAIEYYTKGAEISNYDKAYLSLAKIYTDLAKWDQAISASQNAIKNGAKSGGPYFYMGLAYKNKGDISKAKEMFMEAKQDKTYKKNAEYELSLLK